MTIQVDIFISGAGPVGLFFAYQMAKRGHSVYICDPKPGPTAQSRAILITSRTMEILEARGLADEVLSEAFISSGIRLFRQGQIIGQVDACGDTPFPHMTILPQGKTEDIINARLESETEYKVNWKTEFVSYTQNENGVVSVVKNLETDKEETIKSKYIIGADGSHSKVRKGTSDWTYEGSTVKTKFALADLSVNGDNIENMKDRMNTFMKGPNVLGMVNIMPPDDSKHKQNVFRVFWNVEAYERVEDASTVTHGLRASEAPPSLEFVQEWVDKMTHPLKFEVSDMIWSSWFKINERIANGYRRNRAFVMGDAAHCHSPAGGQGMNLGLQDADNLAWKMSEVLRGTIKDPEGLLDSYSEERYPHAKSTINTTSSATEAGTTDNSVFNYIRTTLVSTALMIPQVRQFSFKTVMQQNITIIPTVSKIMGTSDKGLIKVGDFVPDAATLRKSFTSSSMSRVKTIERKTLRELVAQSNKYSVILTATCPSGVLPNTTLIEQFWKKTSSLPVKRFVIQSACHCHFMKQLPEYASDSTEAEESFHTEIKFDAPTSITQRIGLYSYLSSIFASSIPPCALLVVRPDMYVAHAKLVYDEKDLEGALQFISSLFV